MIADRLLSAICPYNDKSCPKVEDIAEQLDKIHSRLSNVERLIYIIVGLIAVEMGITIV